MSPPCALAGAAKRTDATIASVAPRVATRHRNVRPLNGMPKSPSVVYHWSLLRDHISVNNQPYVIVAALVQTHRKGLNARPTRHPPTLSPGTTERK